MALYPPSYWPLMHARDVQNAKDYRAGIKQRLAMQQAYDYTHGAPVLSSWACTNDWPDGVPKLRPNGANTDEDGPLTLAWFMTPGHLGFANITVVVHFKVDGASALTTDYAHVDFARFGADEVFTATILRTSQESTATVTLPSFGEQTVWKATLRLADTTAADTDYVSVLGISAYYKIPSSADLNVSLPSTAWRAMSQTRWAGGIPEPSGALEWVRDMQLRQHIHRPRPAFHHSFIQSNTSSTSYTRLGAWYVYSPPKAGTQLMQVHLGTLNRESQATYEVRVDGVAKGDTGLIASGGDVQYVTKDITVDWTVPGQVKVEIWGKSDTAGKQIDLVFAAAHIKAQTPTLAGSDTQPTSFTHMQWQRIVAGAGIFETTDKDGSHTGLETLIKNVYRNEETIPSRGLFSDCLYRWHPFGVRSFGDPVNYGNTNKPAPFSLADEDDTTQSIPYNDGTTNTARYRRFIPFGGCGDPTDRRRYRYYFALSAGAFDLRGHGGYGAPTYIKIVHGNWTSDAIDFSQGYIAGEDVDRPNVIWFGPFESAEEVTATQNRLGIEIWRTSRGSDYAPFLAGALVVGLPRNT